MTFCYPCTKLYYRSSKLFTCILFSIEGIFRRIVVRVLRWTQQKGDEEPRLIHKGISFFFDVDHEVQIKMSSLKMAYIKVSLFDRT